MWLQTVAVQQKILIVVNPSSQPWSGSRSSQFCVLSFHHQWQVGHHEQPRPYAELSVILASSVQNLKPMPNHNGIKALLASLVVRCLCCSASNSERENIRRIPEHACKRLSPSCSLVQLATSSIYYLFIGLLSVYFSFKFVVVVQLILSASMTSVPLYTNLLRPHLEYCI